MKSAKLLAFVLVAQLVNSYTVFAKPIVTAPTSAATQSATLNLNLSSKQANISAATLALAKSLSINVGGLSRIINSSSLLTPAEYVAAYEVSSSGVQTLSLSAQGNAIGGHFSLSGSLSQSIGNLVVPQNVSLQENFALTPALNLSGNLTDLGKIFAYSTSNSVSQATFNAGNIYVQAGGLISSSLSLSLNALNVITNSGTVSSSGKLNLSAINVSNQPGAQIVAQQALVVNTESLVNAGSMSSLLSNVAIQDTNATVPLNIINTGGSIQALAGQVNLSSLSGINLTGGNYSAQSIGLTSLGQNVTANVNSFVGPVSVNAGSASVSSQAALDMASLNVTGDPFLASKTSVITAGGNFGTAAFTVLSGNAITLTSALNAGSVYLISGVNFSNTSPGIDSIIGTSNELGSNINTSGSIITASNTVGLLAASSGNVTATGAISASGGSSVYIYANGNVQVGNVTTTGAVKIANTFANVGGLSFYNSTSPLSGALASGTILASSFTTGNIIQNAGTTLTANSVTLATGTGSIGTSAANIKTKAANLSVTIGSSGNAYVSNTGAVNVSVGGTGNAYVINTGDATLGASSLLGTYDMTVNSGKITVGAPVSANVLALVANAASATDGGFVLNANVGKSTGTTTLQANTSGNIQQGSNAAVLGSTVSLTTIAGNIGGTSGGSLQITTPVLTINTSSVKAGNVLVNDTALAVKLNASTADSFTLTDSGTITVAGVLNAAAISLAANANSNGGIVIGANIGSVSTTLSTVLAANGSGVISQTTGLVFGQTAITLSSGYGNIGSATAPIMLSTSGNITSNTNTSTSGSGASIKLGSTFLSDAVSGATLEASVSGGTYSMTANGSLTVDGVTTQAPTSTANGGITVIAGGTLGGKLLINGNVIASGGSITLENSNVTASTNSTIVVNAGVNIHASSLLTTAGLVNIVMGPVPAAPVAGTTPANVLITTSGTGTVNFGIAGGSTITTTSTGGTIQLQALGRNIVFNTGALPSTAIVVNAGGATGTQTTITADPPTKVAALSSMADYVEQVVDTGDCELTTAEDSILSAR